MTVRKASPVKLVCGLQREDERPVRGSLPAACAACGAALWISPAGQEVVRTHARVSILCVSCEAFDAATIPGEATVRPVPGAEEFVPGRRVDAALRTVRAAVERASGMRRRA